MIFKEHISKSHFNIYHFLCLYFFAFLLLLSRFNMCIACTHILYAIVDLFHLWVHYVFVQFIYIILFGQELLYGWKKKHMIFTAFSFYFHSLFYAAICKYCLLCHFMCNSSIYSLSMHFVLVVQWNNMFLFWTYNFGQYSSSIYDNNDITYINKHVFKHFMKFLIRHVNTTLTYLVKKKSRRHKRQLFFHCLL